MQLHSTDLRVDWEDNRPPRGMWHCGPNSGWFTAHHLPTDTIVRVFWDNQYRAREKAMLLLELAVEGLEDGITDYRKV